MSVLFNGQRTGDESLRGKNRGAEPLILVVDDCEDDRLLNTLILDSLGYASITAANGHTALQIAQSRQLDLILLDIRLPDMDGLEVVYRLKHHPQTTPIPVIATTALAMPGDRERALAEGFDDYLTKPYTVEELENIIYCYLRLVA